MKGAKQTTLRDQIALSGIGVHSGRPVTLTLNPAGDDTQLSAFVLRVVAFLVILYGIYDKNRR